MKTSKKIEAGDTLTVGALTDDHLGAAIEVGPVQGIAHRMRLDSIERDDSRIVSMRTKEGGVRGSLPEVVVTVITPPPVVQPDEPKSLGQCIRIEGYDEWWALVADPGAMNPILDVDGEWVSWWTVLKFAGERQIIVSDPPRWPDETPEVPERIERGDWPADDTHLRDYKWIDRDGGLWRWDDRDNRKSGWNWNPYLLPLISPLFGPWTRGNRVEVKAAPKAGDVFTSIGDMPYGWVAKVTLGIGKEWGHVVRNDGEYGENHLWDDIGRYGKMFTRDWAGAGTGTVSGGGYGEVRYTLVETEVYHNIRVARDNA